MVDRAIYELVDYALEKGLIEEMEETWAVNQILGALRLDTILPRGEAFAEGSSPEVPEVERLSRILDVLLDDAYRRGVLAENSVVYRDLLDTEIMGRLTPRPSFVAAMFWELYKKSPKMATDWFYELAQDVNYIRRDRSAKDIRWKAPTEYGELDITINLAKPEKDPKAIAAARNLPASAYPRCLLCAENESYAGRINHPARQNHRVIPMTISNAPWFLQYSPYVYYNEHCICVNRKHTPMRIDRACFDKLLDFVHQFPHYFVGSNADLPIVGGSILAHDHFQGGGYVFAMAKAPVEKAWEFPSYPDVSAGLVKWPMSVVRLSGLDRVRVAELAEKILAAWRGYTDAEATVFAETDGVPHNTITPIARMRDGRYELDLVLRNNLTTDEHPLGLYHPHAELHHIKKENIGLIEVMGLAVLPARLKDELHAVADALVSGADLRANALTEKHADWAEQFKANYEFTEANAWEIVQAETGKVFAKVLEHAGVFKRDAAGRKAFLRFLSYVGEQLT